MDSNSVSTINNELHKYSSLNICLLGYLPVLVCFVNDTT